MSKITLTLDSDSLRERLTIFADAAGAISALDLDPAATEAVNNELSDALIETLLIETGAYGPSQTEELLTAGYIIVGRDTRALQSSVIYNSVSAAENYLDGFGRSIKRDNYDIVPVEITNS